MGRVHAVAVSGCAPSSAPSPSPCRPPPRPLPSFSPSFAGYRDRRAAVGPYHTALASNVLCPPETLRAREDTAYMSETGVGNLVFNRGANAPGAEYGEGAQADFAFSRHVSKAGQGSRTREEQLVRVACGVRGSSKSEGSPWLARRAVRTKTIDAWHP